MQQLNEQRKTVFLDRYAKKDDKGQPAEKTLEEMWFRVAEAIGGSTQQDHETGDTDKFYDILKDFKFVPGGRILAGAGVGTEQTFYNCYVIPVEPKLSTAAYAKKPVGNDSRESIFDTIATMVDIMSRGGGVGINWSTLRPSGSYLSRVSGTSSGPVGWMDVASKAVGEVEQGGSRRGAAMFMLDDWHPDILKFIEAKRDYSKITNANVSVAISDLFMESVKADLDWQLEFPDTSDSRYNTEWDGDLAGWKANGYPVVGTDVLPARDLWRAIIESAHASGEPGVVFLDRYNKQSTGVHAERIISVNPCGEQGLGAYSVCNLGSMNLDAYVTADPDRQNGSFDFAEFGRDTRTAVRFLDNVIDKSFYWDDRSRERQSDLRRIGLGVMGLADALIRMGIRYGSKDAVNFTELVFRTMKDEAIIESMILAQEKGQAGAYTTNVWDRPYLQEFNARIGKSGPLRNLFFLTQAPTGTTSILAGVNSGIEPYFAHQYTRKDRTGVHRVVSPAVEQFIRREQWEVSFDDNGDMNIPPTLPEYFVTANDVTVEEHIAMQAAVQKYVDSSVSKTINGPNSHTIKDVEKAYMLAFDKGLKGLAYFRDGSGRDQVLYKDSLPTAIEINAAEQNAALISDNERLEGRISQLEEEVFVGPMASARSRPVVLTGHTFRYNTSMGTMYLTINEDEEGEPFEVFVNVGKAGSDVMSMGEAIGRLVSMALQRGIPLMIVANQLVGVGGTSSLSPGLVHAIGKALASANLVEPTEQVVQAPSIPSRPTPEPAATSTYTPNFNLCPECGTYSLVREEGCMKCQSCGYSAC